ncbi:putative collagen-binding domain-containing protein [Neoaquamicrobium sediminum]
MTAVAPDRSWSISYLVAPTGVEIDPSKFGAERLSIRWYDPSAGVMGQPTAVSPDQGRPVAVAPPAQQNRAGFADWVLLVSAGE